VEVQSGKANWSLALNVRMRCLYKQILNGEVLFGLAKAKVIMLFV
jgi:hypothetical protein